MVILDAVLRSPSRAPPRATPERLSYQNETVRQFAVASRAMANGVLAAVPLVGGFNVMLRPYLGSSYASARALMPRLLLGASWSIPPDGGSDSRST